MVGYSPQRSVEYLHPCYWHILANLNIRPGTPATDICWPTWTSDLGPSATDIYWPTWTSDLGPPATDMWWPTWTSDLGPPCHWYLVTNLDTRPWTPPATYGSGHWSSYGIQAGSTHPTGMFPCPMHFLPPANEVLGKVMFLHLSVILSTGGLSAPLHAGMGGVCLEGVFAPLHAGIHSPGQTPLLGRHPLPGQTPP